MGRFDFKKIISMKKIDINNPIIIKNKIALSTSIFEGKEIYEQGVEVKFKCPNCQINNSLKIDNDSGSLLDDLYIRKKLITKEEILKKQIAKESPKIYKHLGQFMIFQNLSALYLFFICDNCGAKFMIAFSLPTAASVHLPVAKWKLATVPAITASLVSTTVRPLVITGTESLSAYATTPAEDCSSVCDKRAIPLINAP